MIKRESLERRVLGGIKQQLLTPEMVREFIVEFRSEWNRLSREQHDANQKHANELTSIKRKVAGIINAIEDGEWTPALKQRLRELEQRQAELESQSVTSTPPPNLRLHPSMADLYRRKVEQLETALNDPSVRAEATGVIRSMIDRIRLTPQKDAPEGLQVEVEGDLAAILAAASGKAKLLRQMNPAAATGSTAFQGVAGLGFEPRTFRL